MLPPQADLEVISCLPEDDTSGRPLVFVHGAYCDAWCWGVNFLPWFAQQGHPAYALSLRGHGGSGGRESLIVAGLDDYAHDLHATVTMAAQNHGKPAVLVGHSMGATVVERFVHEAEHRHLWSGAALLAPVPPQGLLPSAARLLSLQPSFLWHVQQVTSGACPADSLHALRDHYFTPAMPPALLAQVAQHIHPESPRAVMDLAFPFAFPPQPPTHIAAGEITVIGGAADAIFTPAQVAQTASRYRTEPIIVPGLPHMLMLEPGWEAAAQAIVDQLD